MSDLAFLRSSRSVANVMRGDELLGKITRTMNGSTFAYERSYLDRVDARDVGVAFSMPPREESYEMHGYNLHPFFSNLLPEGLWLEGIAGRLKTSRDDLLSILAEIGSDTVGDIWLRWPNAGPPSEPEPIDLSATTFRELFRSRYEDELRPLDRTSIPGVQEKVSAGRVTMPLRVMKGSYILKLNLRPEKYARLIENEHFFMQSARRCGLLVASTTVAHDAGGDSGLLVERFDRSGGIRLHQEDVCQILDVMPANKYLLAARDVAAGLSQVATAREASILRWLELYAFSYLIGNGDLHGKNISVTRSLDGVVQVTPAYDLLSTWPYGDKRMALKLDGRDDNIKRENFLHFGERHGVPRGASEKMVERLVRGVLSGAERLDEIGFDRKTTESLRGLMVRRCKHLEIV